VKKYVTKLIATYELNDFVGTCLSS